MNSIIKTKRPLKNCPFCGHKAVIKKQNIWLHDTYRAECIHCGISTKREFANTGIYTNKGFKTLTDKDCINMVTMRWNKRSRKRITNRNTHGNTNGNTNSNTNA